MLTDQHSTSLLNQLTTDQNLTSEDLEAYGKRLSLIIEPNTAAVDTKTVSPRNQVRDFKYPPTTAPTNAIMAARIGIHHLLSRRSSWALEWKSSATSSRAFV